MKPVIVSYRIACVTSFLFIASVLPVVMTCNERAGFAVCIGAMVSSLAAMGLYPMAMDAMRHRRLVAIIRKGLNGMQ